MQRLRDRTIRRALIVHGHDIPPKRIGSTVRQSVDYVDPTSTTRNGRAMPSCSVIETYSPGTNLCLSKRKIGSSSSSDLYEKAHMAPRWCVSRPCSSSVFFQKRRTVHLSLSCFHCFGSSLPARFRGAVNS